MSGEKFLCSCKGCNEYIDTTALDWVCDFCWVYCVHEYWLFEPGETPDGKRMARSLTTIARWKTHLTRMFLLDRGLDVMEWAARIHSGEMPPTVLQLFDGDDPDAAHDRLMFRLRCEDEEPI